MRKTTLAALALLALAGMSLAVPPNQTNLPHPATTAVLPATCSGITDQYGLEVSPTSPTMAVNGSTAPWKAAWVQNMDSTARLYWHYSQSLSTSVNVSTGTMGFMIQPIPGSGSVSNIIQFALQPGVTYYMMNDTSGTTPRKTVAVVQVCR